MLKIKNWVYLLDLLPFGFVRVDRIAKRHDEKGDYMETVYLKSYGDTVIEICANRIDSDWIHPNEVREIYIGIDQECSGGAMENVIETIYDLIQSDLVEKVEE